MKRNDSIFYNTDLHTRLKNIGIDTLFFCGIDTSICVESSIRDGFNLGFDVVMISDATAVMDNESYMETLHDIELYYGLVMETKNLFSSLVLH